MQYVPTGDQHLVTAMNAIQCVEPIVSYQQIIRTFSISNIPNKSARKCKRGVGVPRRQ